MAYSYDVQLVITSNELLLPGVPMNFRETAGGPAVEVTDYQGNSLSLVTSRLSLTPRFMASTPTGYLASASGEVVLPVFSVEAANGLMVATQLAAQKADLSGAAFTGNVSVPEALLPDHAVSLAQVQALIAAAWGGGSGGGSSAVFPLSFPIVLS